MLVLVGALVLTALVGSAAAGPAERRAPSSAAGQPGRRDPLQLRRRPAGRRSGPGAPARTLVLTGFTCTTADDLEGYRQLSVTRELPFSLAPVTVRDPDGRRLAGRVVSAQYGPTLVLAGSTRARHRGRPARWPSPSTTAAELWRSACPDAPSAAAPLHRRAHRRRPGARPARRRPAGRRGGLRRPRPRGSTRRRVSGCAEPRPDADPPLRAAAASPRPGRRPCRSPRRRRPGRWTAPSSRASGPAPPCAAPGGRSRCPGRRWPPPAGPRWRRRRPAPAAPTRGAGTLSTVRPQVDAGGQEGPLARRLQVPGQQDASARRRRRDHEAGVVLRGGVVGLRAARAAAAPAPVRRPPAHPHAGAGHRGRRPRRPRPPRRSGPRAPPRPAPASGLTQTCPTARPASTPASPSAWSAWKWVSTSSGTVPHPESVEAPPHPARVGAGVDDDRGCPAPPAAPGRRPARRRTPRAASPAAASPGVAGTRTSADDHGEGEQQRRQPPGQHPGTSSAASRQPGGQQQPPRRGWPASRRRPPGSRAPSRATTMMACADQAAPQPSSGRRRGAGQRRARRGEAEHRRRPDERAGQRVREQADDARPGPESSTTTGSVARCAASGRVTDSATSRGQPAAEHVAPRRRAHQMIPPLASTDSAKPHERARNGSRSSSTSIATPRWRSPARRPPAPSAASATRPIAAARSTLGSVRHSATNTATAEQPDHAAATSRAPRSSGPQQQEGQQQRQVGARDGGEVREPGRPEDVRQLRASARTCRRAPAPARGRAARRRRPATACRRPARTRSTSRAPAARRDDRRRRRPHPQHRGDVVAGLGRLQPALRPCSLVPTGWRCHQPTSLPVTSTGDRGPHPPAAAAPLELEEPAVDHQHRRTRSPAPTTSARRRPGPPAARHHAPGRPPSRAAGPDRQPVRLHRTAARRRRAPPAASPPSHGASPWRRPVAGCGPAAHRSASTTATDAGADERRHQHPRGAARCRPRRPPTRPAPAAPPAGPVPPGSSSAWSGRGRSRLTRGAQEPPAAAQTRTCGAISA